jgi:hypothetical protein
LIWDRHDTKFFQRKEQEVHEALKYCQPGRLCLSCGLKRLAEQQKQWTVLPNGTLVQGTQHYHINDVVYIRPVLTRTDVYLLGQITAIYPSLRKDAEPTFNVNLYQRFDLAARFHNKSQWGNQEYDEVGITCHVLLLLLML